MVQPSLLIGLISVGSISYPLRSRGLLARLGQALLEAEEPARSAELLGLDELVELLELDAGEVLDLPDVFQRSELSSFQDRFPPHVVIVRVRRLQGETVGSQPRELVELERLGPIDVVVVKNVHRSFIPRE